MSNESSPERKNTKKDSSGKKTPVRSVRKASRNEKPNRAKIVKNIPDAKMTNQENQKKSAGAAFNVSQEEPGESVSINDSGSSSESTKKLVDRVKGFFYGLKSARKSTSTALDQDQAEKKSNKEMKDSVVSQGGQQIEPDGNALFQSNDTVLHLLRGRSVSEILVPRMDMQAAPLNKSLTFYIKIALDSGYSRIPVFGNDIDDIKGILYVKDLLKFAKRAGKESKDFNVETIIRPAYIVPESLNLDELLKNFLKKRIHLAVVVDEYGGVSGIVTLEDVIEEIVGEIQDEYDQEEEIIVKKVAAGQYEIDARLSLEDAQKQLLLDLPDKDFDTVGGFIYHLIGRVPEKNETVLYENLEFKVLSLDGNRIKKVRVKINSE